MTDKEMEHRWATAASKPKTLTVSEMIQNQKAGISNNPGELRAYLVQRVMEKHEFTEEQALAMILAFGG
jgi:hypothetical protein